MQAPQGLHPHAQPMGGGQATAAMTGLQGEHFGGHHVYPHPTQFFFRDKTLYSGNIRKGTTVCNPNGSIAFQTKDAVLSLRNKEVVYDAVGQPIATLHKKTLSMHGTWQIFKGESLDKSALVADIKPGLVDILGKTIKVYLNGSEEPAFIIKGNFLGRSFEFTSGGRTIAATKRQGALHSVSNFLSGQDTFTLDVQPGVDTAVLVMVTLVIDDILSPTGKER
mmetsp:Transcript_12007/g.36061  ORF Transcript_12007/g.36061 Transcript_12007/m.36061 type:complete len:222 (-) Transcript_12007:395-1060(-)